MPFATARSYHNDEATMISTQGRRHTPHPQPHTAPRARQQSNRHLHSYTDMYNTACNATPSTRTPGLQPPPTRRNGTTTQRRGPHRRRVVAVAAARHSGGHIARCDGMQQRRVQPAQTQVRVLPWRRQRASHHRTLRS
jgi:hypothetical protein